MIRRSLLAMTLLALAGLLQSDDRVALAEVWIFTAVDCPIANGYSPEFSRLANDYKGKHIKFSLVYPEPSLSEDEIAKHRTDYALSIPALHDSEHRKVSEAGVTATPEVAVFDGSGKLVYRGKIDDRYTEYGDRRNTATETYLRDVLDQLIAGEQVEFHSTAPIGCFIEALPGN